MSDDEAKAATHLISSLPCGVARQVQGRYTQDKPITDVVIVVPLPKSMKSSSLTANVGTVKQDPMTKVLRWEIGELREEKSPVLEGTIGLPTDFVTDEAPTVTVRARFPSPLSLSLSLPLRLCLTCALLWCGGRRSSQSKPSAFPASKWTVCR